MWVGVAAGAAWPYVVGTETVRGPLGASTRALEFFGVASFCFLYIKLKKYENFLSV